MLENQIKSGRLDELNKSQKLEIARNMLVNNQHNIVSKVIKKRIIED